MLDGRHSFSSCPPNRISLLFATHLCSKPPNTYFTIFSHNTGVSTLPCPMHREYRNSVSQFSKHADLLTSIISLMIAAVVSPWTCMYFKIFSPPSWEHRTPFYIQTTHRHCFIPVHSWHDISRSVFLPFPMSLEQVRHQHLRMFAVHSALRLPRSVSSPFLVLRPVLTAPSTPNNNTFCHHRRQSDCSEPS